MPNLELEPIRDLSPFRRIALGAWRTTYDPSVYGTIELRMDRALDYLQRFRAATGEHLTITHMMARAAAASLRAVPEANSILRFNRLYRRRRVSVFMQVVMTDQGSDKVDLSGVTVHDAADKSLLEIVAEVRDKVSRVRQRRDPALERSRSLFRFIPYMLLGPALRLISGLSYTLNLDLRWAGVPRDAFGSVMITNIGTLGLDTAYVPLLPFSRVPILLAVGEVKEQPVAEDGEVVVRKVMKVNATFDHRVIDGFHAAVMSRTLRAWMERPDAHFGAVPAPVNDASTGSEAP
jgi:pyruvate dehydrogenase E2 component (dihydrolipoamide acetyltransferase)